MLVDLRFDRAAGDDAVDEEDDGLAILTFEFLSFQESLMEA
ncbi:MAG: hypothetical protein AB1714_21995 [Acidobacteriota bacterium]